MKINCLVIDDEQLARKGMEKYVSRMDYLTLAGSAENAIAAMAVLKSEKIDLMLIDIKMPGMSGLQLLKELETPPAAIITTAFQEHALEGFELNVLDYLIKPVPFDRFEKAIQKARDYIQMQKNASLSGPAENYFFIKCGNRFEKINYDDLLFVEAMQNYVILHSRLKRYISYLTFKSVEEYLPSSRFIRVHKSYIVAIDKIDSIDGAAISIGSHSISISRSNKDEILKNILGNKILKRE